MGDGQRGLPDQPDQLVGDQHREHRDERQEEQPRQDPGEEPQGVGEHVEHREQQVLRACAAMTVLARLEQRAKLCRLP